MSVTVILPPSGAKNNRPTDKYTNNPLPYPSGFAGLNDDEYRYLFINNPNDPPTPGKLAVILLQYKKDIKIYFDGTKLQSDVALDPSNFSGWGNGVPSWNNWLAPFHYSLDTVLESLELTSASGLMMNMYGTGYVYTDNTFSSVMVTYGSILSDFDMDMVLDPGVEYDKGGGNQNWGQGNPTTDTKGGTFDDTTDEVGMGEVNSTKMGIVFNHYYVINREQLLKVKENIWGVSIPSYTKPSDAIISLMAFPNIIPNLINTGLNTAKIGNTTMVISDTNDVSTIAANHLNVLTFGTIHMKPYFGGFQDYAPYTKMKLWLPFIGYRDIDPLYVQGCDLEVRYVINYTNGSCIALIYSNEVIIQRHNGQIGQTIPLTQVDNNLIEATMSIATQTAAASMINPAFGVASLAKDSLSSLGKVVNNRPNISGSAGGGGEAEWGTPLELFILIERPQCAVAQTYNHEKGRPSLINKQLGLCRGFTSMVDPQVTAKCTEVENNQINSLLKGGVIINEK